MKQVLIMIMVCLAMQLSAQNTDPVFDKAELLFSEGNYQDAAALYTKVLGSDPENMNAYLRRGFCFSVLKEYDRSISDYSIVIDKHPNHPFAYLSRGSAFNKKEEFKTAMADFDKVLSIDPQNQEAYNNRGWAKNGLGLFKEACADWNTSKKLGNEEAKLILKNNHCK